MDEYFDVLDEKGNKTGLKKLRSEVHRDGDWHASVQIWIVNSAGQLLIQKRAPDKDAYPNMWDVSSAGHVQAGEDGLTTALRELAEELGIKVLPGDLKLLFRAWKKEVLNEGKFINNTYEDVYILERDLDLPRLKYQEEEISALKWIDIYEYKKVLIDENPNYCPITEYQEKLFAFFEKKYGSKV